MPREMRRPDVGGCVGPNQIGNFAREAAPTAALLSNAPNAPAVHLPRNPYRDDPARLTPIPAADIEAIGLSLDQIHVPPEFEGPSERRAWLMAARETLQRVDEFTQKHAARFGTLARLRVSGRGLSVAENGEHDKMQALRSNRSTVSAAHSTSISSIPNLIPPDLAARRAEYRRLIPLLADCARSPLWGLQPVRDLLEKCSTELKRIDEAAPVLSWDALEQLARELSNVSAPAARKAK